MERLTRRAFALLAIGLTMMGAGCGGPERRSITNSEAISKGRIGVRLDDGKFTLYTNAWPGTGTVTVSGTSESSVESPPVPWDVEE